MSQEPRIRAQLLVKTDVSEGLAIFRFALESDFHFEPGQYATLWLTHRGKTIPRPYSIASSPSELRVLEFYINLVSEGRLTPSLWDEEMLQGLRRGDPETLVTVTGPKGRFTLDPQDPRDLVFVASGTGLAPFISMIRKLHEDSVAGDSQAFRPRRIIVVHGVSRSANLAYDQELARLAAETQSNPACRLGLVYLATVSRPGLDPAWSGLKGRAEALFEPLGQPDSSGLQQIVRGMLAALLRPETHAVYVCGHPGTIDSTTHALSVRGFKPDADVKREKYYT